MGACVSSGDLDILEGDDGVYKKAEEEGSSKEPKPNTRKQVKVLLFGTGDSGKSTILKQMRLVHHSPFTPTETECNRQLIFINLTRGLKCVIDEMTNMGLRVTPRNQHCIRILEGAGDIEDNEPFPVKYHEALKRLWEDPNVQAAYARGNEAALPDYLLYYYADLDRFFKRSYVPSEEDVVHSHVRTTGIYETLFRLRDHDMLVVDVGGQRSERRKWIHCFQNVTCVSFAVSLSGYDQCLVEDKHINQMMDAMTVWDSICHRSRWFERTPIILFLNKNDLFERKIQTSHINTYFPDYDGEKGDAEAGREYFVRRFAELARKDNPKEREVFISVTTATDTVAFRAVMASMEDILLRQSLDATGLV